MTELDYSALVKVSLGILTSRSHIELQHTMLYKFDLNVLFLSDCILIFSCLTFLGVIETVLPIEDSTVGMVIQVAHGKESVGQTP